MRIELDVRTCQVCGDEHADHIIDADQHWWAPIWEPAICDECDDWARTIEMSAMGPSAGKLIKYWGAGIGGPGFMRGRA